MFSSSSQRLKTKEIFGINKWNFSEKGFLIYHLINSRLRSSSLLFVFFRWKGSLICKVKNSACLSPENSILILIFPNWFQSFLHSSMKHKSENNGGRKVSKRAGKKQMKMRLKGCKIWFILFWRRTKEIFFHFIN